MEKCSVNLVQRMPGDLSLLSTVCHFGSLFRIFGGVKDSPRGLHELRECRQLAFRNLCSKTRSHEGYSRFERRLFEPRYVIVWVAGLQTENIIEENQETDSVGCVRLSRWRGHRLSRRSARGMLVDASISWKPFQSPP